jgi:V/A-type H+-transporting ATPase subunit K
MVEAERKLKSQITQSILVLTTVMAIIGILFCSNAFAAASHDEGSVEPAAVAFGLGALGAGFAISHVGAAAMGAVAEKPQVAGQALIFVALAEGIVVFGLVTAFLILNKV